jgi:hypothetical protein
MCSKQFLITQRLGLRDVHIVLLSVVCVISIKVSLDRSDAFQEAIENDGRPPQSCASTDSQIARLLQEEWDNEVCFRGGCWCDACEAAFAADFCATVVHDGTQAFHVMRLARRQHAHEVFLNTFPLRKGTRITSLPCDCLDALPASFA